MNIKINRDSHTYSATLSLHLEDDKEVHDDTIRTIEADMEENGRIFVNIGCQKKELKDWKAMTLAEFSALYKTNNPIAKDDFLTVDVADESVPLAEYITEYAKTEKEAIAATKKAFAILHHAQAFDDEAATLYYNILRSQLTAIEVFFNPFPKKKLNTKKTKSKKTKPKKKK
jgi:hypothetical protein